MDLREYLKLVYRKKQTLIAVLAVFLVLSLIITAIQPFQYKSSVKLLVIQNFDKNIDPYAASKSNEYLSNILSKVAYSDYFLNQVLSSDFDIDKSYFASDINKRIKKWEKMINVNPVENTGIINIDVFHTSAYQAEQIVRAVSRVLIEKNNDYHGYGNSVNIKIIEGPITSKWPVKPNILLNLVLAAALGLIAGLNYIYLFPEERNYINFFSKRKKREDNQIAQKQNIGLPASIFAEDELDLKYESNVEFENKKEEYVKKLIDRNIIGQETVGNGNGIAANRENTVEKIELKEIKGEMDNIFGR